MTAVTVYGVCAVSFMMAMYALEHRGRRFVLAFVLGCLLSSAYGFLSGAPRGALVRSARAGRLPHEVVEGASVVVVAAGAKLNGW